MLTNLTPASLAAKDMMEKLGMVTKDGGNIFYDSTGQMKSFAQVQQILLHTKISGLNPADATACDQDNFWTICVVGNDGYRQ
jgi:hypothetical protein